MIYHSSAQGRFLTLCKKKFFPFPVPCICILSGTLLRFILLTASCHFLGAVSRKLYQQNITSFSLAPGPPPYKAAIFVKGTKVCINVQDQNSDDVSVVMTMMVRMMTAMTLTTLKVTMTIAIRMTMTIMMTMKMTVVFVTMAMTMKMTMKMTMTMTMTTVLAVAMVLMITM